jgi:hypothetical protein
VLIINQADEPSELEVQIDAEIEFADLFELAWVLGLTLTKASCALLLGSVEN